MKCGESCSYWYAPLRFSLAPHPLSSSLISWVSTAFSLSKPIMLVGPKCFHMAEASGLAIGVATLFETCVESFKIVFASKTSRKIWGVKCKLPPEAPEIISLQKEYQDPAQRCVSNQTLKYSSRILLYRADNFLCYPALITQKTSCNLARSSRIELCDRSLVSTKAQL